MPGGCFALRKANTGDFDRSGRKFQNTGPRKQEKVREMGSQVQGYYASTRPKWVASACVYSDCHLQGLCSFRKSVYEKTVQLNYFGEPWALIVPSLFGMITKVSGVRVQAPEPPGLPMDYLSSTFASGAPTFLSSYFCLPLPPCMKTCSLEILQPINRFILTCERLTPP